MSQPLPNRRWLIYAVIAICLTALGTPSQASAERIGAKLKLERTKFRAGQEIRLQGVRFDRKADVRFQITGLSSSCKEGQVIAEDWIRADKGGNLDTIVYMVQWDDCGWYEVTAEQVNREARPISFRVKGPAEPPDDPEEEAEPPA